MNLQALYQKYVLDQTRDDTVLDMFGHNVTQGMFVECFKYEGRMHSEILDVQCKIWGEKRKEIVILSQAALVSSRSTYLIFFYQRFFI